VGELNETQRYLIDEHIEEYQDGLISRRELLRRVTLISGSAKGELRFALATKVELKAETKVRRYSSPEVVGLIPGADPKLKDEYVVLNASLDSLGMGAPAGGDTIYNGVSDAAGVAALLEVARAFTRLPVAPRRSVLFLATAGEAKRPCGSEFFVKFGGSCYPEFLYDQDHAPLRSRAKAHRGSRLLPDRSATQRVRHGARRHGAIAR